MAKKPTKAKKTAIRLAAEAVARDLMTNGNGDAANRLVLVGRDGSDLGGRNFESVAGTIEKHLAVVIEIYDAGKKVR